MGDGGSAVQFRSREPLSLILMAGNIGETVGAFRSLDRRHNLVGSSLLFRSGLSQGAQGLPLPQGLSLNYEGRNFRLVSLMLDINRWNNITSKLAQPSLGQLCSIYFNTGPLLGWQGAHPERMSSP